jgi:hypothetical protein
MRVVICGKVWELVFVKKIPASLCPDDTGVCDAPTTKNKKILVSERMKDRDRLETLIHELLHAANWNMDEG